MRICNNKNGILDCYGGCYKDGLCISKAKCEDSLVVNENMIKQLMKESGRHDKIIKKCNEQIADESI